MTRFAIAGAAGYTADAAKRDVGSVGQQGDAVI
jgi:hypothetical protein